MNIDTTATILQLSSALAASAGVAAPSQADGADLATPAVVTTCPAGPNQQPLSFLQLLAQVQQLASDASQPTATAETPVATATDVPHAKDATSDPTSISNALLALLSQSNQPSATHAPVVPERATEANQQPVQAIGSAPPQAAGTVPTVAVDSPEANATGTVPASPPAADFRSDGKMQPIEIGPENATTQQTVESASGNSTPSIAKSSDPNAKIDLTGLPTVANGSQADQQLFSQDVTATQATANTITTQQPQPEIAAAVSSPSGSTDLVATNASDLKPDVALSNIPIPPTDATTQVGAPKVADTGFTTEKISSTGTRRTRYESLTTAVSTTAKESHIDFSNLANLIGDTVAETSSDLIEPLKEFSDDAKSKVSPETNGIDIGVPGESMTAGTEASNPVDPAIQGVTVDSHSLAHHLESMAMQRLDQPESTDKSSVVLRLDPPELGRVSVHMSVTNDVVSIRMVTSDDAARQAIERQLNELQQSLTDKGIAFQEFQVQSGGAGQQSSDRGFRKQWADNSGYSAFSGRRATTAVATPAARSGILAQLNYVA